jgi:ribosomal protein L7/L12
MLGPLRQVKLAEDDAICLRQEGWKKELVIATADSQTHVFDVPIFDQGRAQRCFSQPESTTVVPPASLAPLPPSAPTPAFPDAAAPSATNAVLGAETKSANVDNSALEAEVAKLIPDSKIQAIKLWRQRTGVGLKEAKEAVDALAARIESSRLATPVVTIETKPADVGYSALEAEVAKLIPDAKIQAIKLWRERTGVGLKEAKEAVEALAARSAPPPVSSENGLLKRLLSDFKREHGIDLSSDPMAMQRLTEAAQKAILALRTASEAEINLPFLTADAQGPKHLRQSINSDDIQPSPSYSIPKPADSLGSDHSTQKLSKPAKKRSTKESPNNQVRLVLKEPQETVERVAQQHGQAASKSPTRSVLLFIAAAFIIGILMARILLI